VSVEELTGSLEPHEVKKCLWKFKPDKIEKYVCKAVLVVWVDGEQASSTNYNLRMLGECTYGSLQAGEMYKDFGSVIVGASVTNEIVVINNNDCSLEYELFVKQSSGLDKVEDEGVNSLCVLELETSSGRVEARSRNLVRCRLRPTKLVNYQFTIEYRIVYPYDDGVKGVEKSGINIGSNPSSPKNEKEIFCYMTANGVYPKLRVNDIKCLGSASSLSQDYFWRLLSIDQ